MELAGPGPTGGSRKTCHLGEGLRVTTCQVTGWQPGGTVLVMLIGRWKEAEAARVTWAWSVGET